MLSASASVIDSLQKDVNDVQRCGRFQSVKVKEDGRCLVQLFFISHPILKPVFFQRRFLPHIAAPR